MELSLASQSGLVTVGSRTCICLKVVLCTYLSSFPTLSTNPLKISNVSNVSASTGMEMEARDDSAVGAGGLDFHYPHPYKFQVRAFHYMPGQVKASSPEHRPNERYSHRCFLFEKTCCWVMSAARPLTEMPRVGACRSRRTGGHPTF